MREKLRGQDLSFTDIARIVGEKWQELSPNDKEPCEREARSLKGRYYSELAEYKKTSQYSAYQEYLQDFKAKHGPSSSQGKRTFRVQPTCVLIILRP